MPKLFHFIVTLSTLWALLLCQSNAIAQDQDIKAPRVKVAVSLALNTSDESAIELAKALAQALNSKLFVRAEAGNYIQTLLPATAKEPECLGQNDCLVNAANAVHADHLLLLVIVQVADYYKVETTAVNSRTGTVSRRAALEIGTNNKDFERSFEDSANSFLPDAMRRPQGQSASELVAAEQARDRQAEAGNSAGNDNPSSGRHMTRGAWIATGIGAAAGVGWAVSVAILASEDDDEVDGFNPLIGDAAAALTIGSLGVAAYLYLKSDSSPDDARPVVQLSGDKAVFGYEGTF